MIEIRVEPPLAPIVSIGLVEVSGVSPAPSPALEEESRCAVERALGRHRANDEAFLAAIAAAREMFRELSIDPTKVRPSSEALLRRVAQGKPFPRIHPLVDAVNLASLEAQAPFGLYDRATLEPPIVVRLGRAGEGYAGIRKERVNLEGRIAVTDANGPFGNPSGDSDRTKIAESTREAVVLLFAPASHAAAWIERTLEETVRRIEGAGSGRVAMARRVAV